jgi:hypothetical protein
VVAVTHDFDRCGLPDHEMTDRDDEFVGVVECFWSK